MRELAERISEETNHRERRLNPGSLWIWLRNENGYPHPKSCTKGRLAALARILRIPLPRLQESLDASRHLFTAREHSEPKESQRAIEEFIEIIKHDKRAYLPRLRVLHIAESLRESSRSTR